MSDPTFFVRVEDKNTGHQFDVPPAVADSTDGLRKINASVQWPDITDPLAYARPPLYRTDKAGNPAPKAGSPATTEES